MDTLNYTPSPGERDDPPPAQVPEERVGVNRAGRGVKGLNVMKDKEGTLGWKEMKKKSLNEVSNSVHGGGSR